MADLGAGIEVHQQSQAAEGRSLPPLGWRSIQELLSGGAARGRAGHKAVTVEQGSARRQKQELETNTPSTM